MDQKVQYLTNENPHYLDTQNNDIHYSFTVH